ncbi:hypothetical protein HK100_000341 [Physocladia obscura]|uniref:Uncharacterized protein n=1 Tax=Physocladia obscura TaxID=109957 RepID=A0AAD5XCK8_9FUNG|nr:hypothetical protein HK100_000341 [Physocladia obscura]
MSAPYSSASLPSFHEIISSSPHSEPVHMAFNPIIPHEAVWICANRNIYLWDLLSAPEDPRRQIRSIGSATSTDNNVTDNNLKWKSIEYSWHPRVLAIGESKKVSVLDLRVEQLFLFIEFHINTLRGIATNPQNQFEMGICGTSKTSLVDTRFPKIPVIEWNIENMNDPPVGIQFLHVDQESAIMTWNFRHGEIIVHPYKSSSIAPSDNLSNEKSLFDIPHTPPHSTYSSQRIPPFHSFDSLYCDPCGDSQFRPQFRGIRQYHEEEPFWGTQSMSDVFQKSKKKNPAANKASDQGQIKLKPKTRILKVCDNDYSTVDSDNHENSVEINKFKTANNRKFQNNTDLESNIIPRSTHVDHVAANNIFRQRWGKKDEFRRIFDNMIPPWPGLIGVAFHDCGNGGVDIFQGAADGAMYRQKFEAGNLFKSHDSSFEKDVRKEKNDASSTSEIILQEINSQTSNEEYDEMWINAVEKRVLEAYEELPYLKQDVIVINLFSHIKYISKLLLHEIPSDKNEAVESQVNISDAAAKLIAKHSPKTLFEMYESAKYSIPINYSNGIPIILHPRSSTRLLESDSVSKLVATCNTMLSKSDTNFMHEDQVNFMDVDAAQLIDDDASYLVEDNDDNSSNPLKKSATYIRKIPLDFLNLFEPPEGSSFEDNFTINVIRAAIERNFLTENIKYYSKIPKEILTLNNTIGMNGVQIAKELNQKGDLTKKNAIEWIARDILLSSSILDGIHFTIEGPPKNSKFAGLSQAMVEVIYDAETEDQDNDDDYEDVDPTIKKLLDDPELDLPSTAKIHNSMMLASPFALSREAILLRDKWLNSQKWYDDENEEAQRRMQIQVSIKTYSKRQSALEGTYSVPTEEEEGKKKKEKKKDIIKKDDVLMLASQQESQRVSTQTRVIASSNLTQQAASLSLSSQPFARHTLRGVVSQSQVSSPKQNSIIPKGSLLSMLGQQSSIGSRFGSQEAASPNKKKPRKSGF